MSDILRWTAVVAMTLAGILAFIIEDFMAGVPWILAAMYAVEGWFYEREARRAVAR